MKNSSHHGRIVSPSAPSTGNTEKTRLYDQGLIGMAVISLFSNMLNLLGAVVFAIIFIVAISQIPIIKNIIGHILGWFLKSYFDRKLEKVKSDLRREEDVLRAEVERLKNAVGAGLSVFTGQQTALLERRIKAIEALWEAKVFLDGSTMLVMMMSILKADEVQKVLKLRDGQGLKNLLDSLDKNSLVKDNTVLLEVTKNRPFLTAELWALYTAYMTFPMLANLKLIALRGGFMQNDDRYWSESGVVELVDAVAPECVEDLKQNGALANYRTMRVIEQKLIIACQVALSGQQQSEDSVERALKLQELATKATAAINETQFNSVQSQFSEVMKEK